MATFSAFLKAQDHRQDAVGDLARTWARDKGRGTIRSVDGVRKRVTEAWGDAERVRCLPAVDAAAAEYNASRQTPAGLAEQGPSGAVPHDRAPLAAVPDPPAEPGYGRTLTEAELAAWKAGLEEGTAAGAPSAGMVPDELRNERRNRVSELEGREPVDPVTGRPFPDRDRQRQDEAVAGMAAGTVQDAQQWAERAAAYTAGLAGDRTAESALDAHYRRVIGEEPPERRDTDEVILALSAVIMDVVAPALDQITKRLDWQSALLEAIAPDHALAAAAAKFMAEQGEPAPEDFNLLQSAASAEYGE